MNNENLPNQNSEEHNKEKESRPDLERMSRLIGIQDIETCSALWEIYSQNRAAGWLEPSDDDDDDDVKEALEEALSTFNSVPQEDINRLMKVSGITNPYSVVAIWRGKSFEHPEQWRELPEDDENIRRVLL